MTVFRINSHTLGRTLLVFDAVVALLILICVDNLFGWPFSFSNHFSLHHGTFVLLLATSCFSMGLYRNCYKIPKQILQKLTLSFAVNVSVMFALSLLFSAFRTEGTTNLIAAFCGCSAVLLTRLVAARVASREGFQRRVLVVGSSRHASTLRHLQHADRTTRFTFLSGMDGAGAADAQAEAERLTQMGRALKVHDLIVPDDYQVPPAMAAALLQCRLEGARVTLMSAFLEKETRKVELTDGEAHRLMLTCSARRETTSRFLKRLIDIVGSLSLLVFTLPLLVVVMIAIKLEGGGPIFYRQARMGMGGKPFMITKFRTMRVDAEADGVSRWASQKDDRITAVGRILRRPRIDEIPQLFEVLSGRMSLVGPRPEQVQICETLAASIPLYGYRHLVPPGLTGWAQINLPYAASLQETVEKTRYDLYYLKNGSVVLDLIILVQTIRIVLFSEGSR